MRRKRGVALIWVLILSTVLMIIAGTMVNYIVKESRFSVRMEESTQVYAAAKSGIDWAKWMVDEGKPIATTPYLFDFLNAGDGAETEVLISGDKKIITSTAKHNGVTRKLKYNIADKKSEEFNPDRSGGSLDGMWMDNNTESFEMSFDFWGGGLSYQVGLHSYDRKNALFMKSEANGDTRLFGTHEGKQIISNTFRINANSEPYTYRATIKYIKGTAAKLIVTKTDNFAIPPVTTCVGTEVIPLVGLNFGDLSLFNISSQFGTPTYGPAADGKVAGKIINLNDQVYIDNIFASFIDNAKMYTVSASVSPAASGTIRIDGVAVGSVERRSGVDVTLSALNNNGYEFSKWIGDTCPLRDSTNATISFLVTGNTSCTAVFGTAPPANIKVSASTGGTASGGGSYTVGAIITLSASPSPGYSFSGWSGCSTSTANPLTYTVTGNATCTANFGLIKIPIYQFYTASLTDHLYSTVINPPELASGWVYEGLAFNGANSGLSGAIPVYRYWDTGIKNHFYTTSYSTYTGYSYEGVAFYAFPSTATGAVAVHRYWNGTDHFYTKTNGSFSGYTYEGIAWYTVN